MMLIMLRGYIPAGRRRTSNHRRAHFLGGGKVAIRFVDNIYGVSLGLVSYAGRHLRSLMIAVRLTHLKME